MDCWELQFSPLPLAEIGEQVAAWLGQLPHPAVIEIAASESGLKMRLYAPPGAAQGAAAAWAAMTHQQTRWKPVTKAVRSADDAGSSSTTGKWYALRAGARLPVLSLSLGDAFLAVGGRLLDQVTMHHEAALRIWILGRDAELQERLRALAAYAYGTESGVTMNSAPNPWGLRLAVLRFLLLLGITIAALSGGSIGAGWVSPALGASGVLGGGVVALAAALGVLDWMQWRSIPKELLEGRAAGTLLRVGFTLESANPGAIDLLAGSGSWRPIHPPDWPAVKAFAMSLPAAEIAALVTPPELGEGSGLIARDARQDVPAPPPARPLVEAQFKIGRSAATGEPIGIDPDGHGLAVGGSRTGKSSFAYALLRRLAGQGEEAPGIFLVDPHVSLADAFLQVVDELPAPERLAAIHRLRVLTPDQPEVIPLNLLAVPDFTWAGNAIVQVGRRIWEDYWGPRMQAAMLGLFRLAHAWNEKHPGERMGLLHTVFAAFNVDWRHSALAYLSPVERMGTLALDALLGQFDQSYSGKWGQGWVTEVVSPILSKAMALELSPWLFAAMHQDRFVDLERWISEKAWIVLRLPAGQMGREGTRLTAGIFYNVFDAAYRRATASRPIPFYFVIDEAQEIGAGMRLEALLSEGAKFGARMFVLAQSLSMMRRVEGFEPVVQSLLANTSTQAFFSPDPEDADLIRAALSATVRYGATTLDLPTLSCWLRARIGGRWQPPTLAEVAPLAAADPQQIQALIREVIATHPEDYASPAGWQERAVRALTSLVPPNRQGLLSELLSPGVEGFAAPTDTERGEAEAECSQEADPRRLGF